MNLDECNELHHCAQMGKECVEHVQGYILDDNLYETATEQNDAYESFMHKMEKRFPDVKDIGAIKSMGYNAMLNLNLAANHDQEDLLLALIKGNFMGIEAMSKFLLDKGHSQASKKYAKDMLTICLDNMLELLDHYVL